MIISIPFKTTREVSKKTIHINKKSFMKNELAIPSSVALVKADENVKKNTEKDEIDKYMDCVETCTAEVNRTAETETEKVS